MFCSESCEHGLNATSAGKFLGPIQPSQTGAEQATQAQMKTQVQEQPQQFHMCCPSLPGPGAVEMEPPRVGMCFVTEGPEGLSIDCNVPLPNSFNLEEFKKHMSCCCCCPPVQQGNHYFDGFCNMPPAPPPSHPLSQQQTQPSQPLPGSSSQMPSCGCQCCQCACPCLPCYEQPIASHGGSHSPRSPSKSSKQEARCMAQQPQVPSMMPPFFCVATPANTQTPQMECPCLVGPMHMENGATFLCSMIPATQQQLQQPMPPPHSCHFPTIGVMPLQSPPHLHLQQQQQQQQQHQQQQQQQESQPPLSPQLLRFDFPFPCPLTDFRQDKDKSCCEPMPSSSSPLAFQVYAPMGPPPTAFTQALATEQPRPPPSDPANAPLETEDAESASGVPAASTTPPPTATMGKRSCLRNKPDPWIANGPPQIQNSFASPGNNVCMKCGNCWHCPRCSNCHWHPSVEKRR